MPIQQLPSTDRTYYLACYDKDGTERGDDPDGLLSDRVVGEIQQGGVTDVFLVCHGWKGDVPAAVEQYDAWMGAMARSAADLARMHQQDPNYRPLLVGLHWPSQPWGEEEFGGGGSAFDAVADPEAGDHPPLAATAELTDEELVARYADRLSDAGTPEDELRAQLRIIVAAARENVAPFKLPEDVAQAYRRVDALALGGRASGTSGSPPAEDRDPFDPQRAYHATKGTAASFGIGGALGGLMGGILSPLRQLSFWKMKQRAQVFGERGAAPLLARVQDAGGPSLRVHCAGHSFGCIAVSAMLHGADPAAERPPVSSAALLQGALSLWSYCSHIEQSSGEPGYFQPVLERRRVRGAIVTTQSRFDRAVGFWYPKAAGVAGEVAFAAAAQQLPKYGGIGTFGVQGPDTNAVGMAMGAADTEYGFARGGVYNLNADAYIKDGGGFSGAHSDIAHPEVAHAVWAAVLADVD